MNKSIKDPATWAPGMLILFVSSDSRNGSNVGIITSVDPRPTHKPRLMVFWGSDVISRQHGGLFGVRSSLEEFSIEDLNTKTVFHVE